MPPTATLMTDLRAQGVPAVVSGAGPTVLALTTRATRDAVAVPRQDWRVLALDVETRGAHVVGGA
jgi:homoserine kinase